MFMLCLVHVLKHVRMYGEDTKSVTCYDGGHECSLYAARMVLMLGNVCFSCLTEFNPQFKSTRSDAQQLFENRSIVSTMENVK